MINEIESIKLRFNFHNMNFNFTKNNCKKSHQIFKILDFCKKLKFKFFVNSWYITTFLSNKTLIIYKHLLVYYMCMQYKLGSMCHSYKI